MPNTNTPPEPSITVSFADVVLRVTARRSHQGVAMFQLDDGPWMTWNSAFMAINEIRQNVSMTEEILRAALAEHDLAAAGHCELVPFSVQHTAQQLSAILGNEVTYSAGTDLHIKLTNAQARRLVALLQKKEQS